MAEDTNSPENRGSDGRFGAGNRANPGGRPRMSDAERTMLGDACPKAIQTLVAALDAERTFLVGGGENSHLETAPDHDVRIKAANTLLDRRYGKPAQTITGDEGGPLQVQNVDLTTLSDAQFAALVALRDALKANR